jgi:hypothetical protein
MNASTDVTIHNAAAMFTVQLTSVS